MSFPLAAAVQPPCQNTGDTEIPHRKGVYKYKELAYDPMSPNVHAAIACVFDDTLADELQDAVGPNGSKRVFELGNGELLGVSDYNSIGVNTIFNDGDLRMTEFEFAMTLAHEFNHSKRASANGGMAGDPSNAGACGDCNHVDQHTGEMNALIEKKEQLTGAEGFDDEDICAVLDNHVGAADQIAKGCLLDQTCPTGTAIGSTSGYLDTKQTAEDCCE